MHRFWILIVFNFYHAFAFGQIDIDVLSNSDPSANYFYVRWENIIQVKGIRDLAGYKVTTSANCELQYLGTPGLYIVEARKPGSCQISISKNEKQVFSKTFRTDTIAFHPIGRVGAAKDSVLSKSQLLLNPFLSVVVPGEYYNRFNLRVTSFTAIFITNGDSIVTYASVQDFTEEQIKWIRQLNPGDQIYFTSIRAQGASYFCWGRLPPFLVTVK